MSLDAQDIKLLKECRRGQRAAQQALYQRHKVNLCGVASRYAKSRPEAEKILQESFYKMVKDLQKLISKIPIIA